jgi:hypothetical protein
MTKELKDWVNSLPDDAIIHVLSSQFMSIPLSSPVLYALDRKSLRKIGGFMAGKTISSVDLPAPTLDASTIDQIAGEMEAHADRISKTYSESGIVADLKMSARKLRGLIQLNN